VTLSVRVARQDVLHLHKLGARWFYSIRLDFLFNDYFYEQGITRE
jgi:hypothetical protein